MKFKLAILLSAVSLAGCASRPSDIAPAYVSTAGYKTMSCATLEEEAAHISARAVSASGAQEKAATQDALVTTVGVVLFWPALFFNKGDGTTAAELSRLKGEMEAIEMVSREKNCGIVFQRG